MDQCEYVVSPSGSVGPDFLLQERFLLERTGVVTLLLSWLVQTDLVGWSLGRTGWSLEDPCDLLNSILLSTVGALDTIFLSDGMLDTVSATAGMLDKVFNTAGTLDTMFPTAGTLDTVSPTARTLALIFSSGTLRSIFSLDGDLCLIRPSTGRLGWLCCAILFRRLHPWLWGHFLPQFPGGGLPFGIPLQLTVELLGSVPPLLLSWLHDWLWTSMIHTGWPNLLVLGPDARSCPSGLRFGTGSRCLCYSLSMPDVGPCYGSPQAIIRHTKDKLFSNSITLFLVLVHPTWKYDFAT